MATKRTQRRAAATIPAPPWLILADVAPASMAVYCALGLLADADGVARVRLTELAHILGYSRSDKISKFLRELTRVGAVTVLRPPAVRALAEFQVCTEPPAGYTGPRSLDEWRERRRLAVAA